MKKIFYFLSLAAVASLALTSCVEEVKPHEPGEPEASGCYGVYFPTQDASGENVFNPTQDKVIDITVARTNTSGAITVPIKMTFSEDGIFEAAPVTFADGQEETTFSVRFDKAKEGVKYVANFVIEDSQYASKYNANPIGFDFSVMCVEMLDFLNPKTKEPAVITLNEGWWGEVHQAKMRYYEVDGVRTCTIYSIEEGKGIWGDTQDITLQFTWYTKNNNNNGHNFLEVKKQYFGFDYADWASKPVGQAANPIFVYDYPWYWIERGEAWGVGSMGADWLDEAKKTGQEDGTYPVGYYDGNGGFYFTLRYYIPGLGGFSSNPYEFVAIVDGFTRVDYSLELEADYSYDGATPIYVEAGADIASLKYAVYPGELTATQVGNKVEAIAAGTESAAEFSKFEFDQEEAKNYGTLLVTAPSTGTYTLVAVAYDKEKKAQADGSVVFKYISAADNATYAVDIDVFTEDTPARYQKFHDYDSFAYCVSGSDLTEVHVAIYTEATVAKYGGDAVLADAKENAAYALSADQLAQANADGGFYDIASGLSPNTTYYVIVWATNGSLDDYALDAYTTAKLPYSWKSLGKGVINDGFFNYLFNNKPETKAACDVYEEANAPGLYMVTGFQCAVSAGFFGVTPADMLPYEGGNWRNAEVVIDATKPNAVTIEEQDYGICVNSAYGFFGIRSSKPGTLKDGVITFPKEGLDCYLDGYGWIPANDEGTFSITLPSAAPSSIPAKPAGNGAVEDVSVKATITPNQVEKVVYERDPKAVDVTVTVSYDRKVKDHKSYTIE